MTTVKLCEVAYIQPDEFLKKKLSEAETINKKYTSKDPGVAAELLGIDAKKLYRNFDIALIRDNLDKIIPLLPKRRREILTLQLQNTYTAVANGLRMALQGEIGMLRLTANVEIVDTEDRYVAKQQLVEHLGLIPVKQNIPVDAVFAINVDPVTDALPGLFDSFAYVMSEQIVSVNPGIRAEDYIFPGFRIVKLNPIYGLRVPKITVTSGNGADNARFIGTDSPVVYNETDYVPISVLNKKNLNQFIARTRDINKHLRVPDPTILQRYRILNIPDFENIRTCKIPEIVNTFDYTLSDPNLQYYTPESYDSEEYELIINTTGVIKIRDLCRAACEAIIKKSEKIEAAIKDLQNGPSVLVNVNRSEDIYYLTIRGEDFLIGNLLRESILILNPGIAFIACETTHDLDRIVIIRIRHPDPTELVFRALEKIRNEYRAIIAGIHSDQ